MGLYKGQMTSKCSHFLLLLASGYLNIPSCRIYPESNNIVPVKLEAAEIPPRVMRQSAIITVKCDQIGVGEIQFLILLRWLKGYITRKLFLQL